MELGFDGDHKICLKWVAFIYKENCYPRRYLYTLWACPLLQVWYYSTSEYVFICDFIKKLSCGIAMTCWRTCFGIRGLLARTPLLVLQRTCSASMMTFWKNCQNKPDVRHTSWKKNGHNDFEQNWTPRKYFFLSRASHISIFSDTLISMWK